jgi:hypothetical protein
LTKAGLSFCFDSFRRKLESSPALALQAILIYCVSRRVRLAGLGAMAVAVAALVLVVGRLWLLERAPRTFPGIS